MTDNMYCRLCLCENNLIDMSGSILAFIKNVFLMEINDGYLSQDICRKCNEFVSKMIKFKDKVDQVQKLLRKILRRKVTHVSPSIDHIDVVEDPNDVTTESKDELFSKLITTINLDDVEKTAEMGYTCSICSMVFTRRSEIASHSLLQHKILKKKKTLIPDTIIPKKGYLSEVKSEVIVDEPPTYKKHQCKICQKLFGFRQTLHNHIKKKHDGVFICADCDFTSINKKCFTKHLRKKHFKLTNSQRICSICFKICNSYADLHKHRRNHETEILPVSTICNSKFTNLTLSNQKGLNRTQPQIEKIQKKIISHIPESCAQLEFPDAIDTEVLSSIMETTRSPSEIEMKPTKTISKSKKSRRMKARARNLKYEKKIIQLEKTNKPPTANVSIDSRKKKEIICNECGMVFTETKYLRNHLLIAHSSLADKISEANSMVHKIRTRNKNPCTTMRKKCKRKALI